MKEPFPARSPGPLSHQIRGACRRVAKEADHVQIIHPRLTARAAALSRLPMSLPALDPDCHYFGRSDETAAFILTLDAVNFGSASFDHRFSFAGKTGYSAIAAALRNRYLTRGPLTAGELAALSGADCARIFGQDPDGPFGQLMESFARSLNELGSLLQEEFGGRFMALLEAAEGSAERLVELLATLPSYRDVALFKGFEVPFLKRAQITAADLSLALGTELFRDLENLTIFADNTVPHVLRVDGVLDYAPHLAARIDAGERVDAGGAEEVEIRACALHACELILSEIRRSGRRVCGMQLDYFLWNQGQQPPYTETPGHLARTIYY